MRRLAKIGLVGGIIIVSFGIFLALEISGTINFVDYTPALMLVPIVMANGLEIDLFCNQPESYYNIINGTDKSNYLFGTNAPDLIFANGGNDIILSKGPNNCIYGGDGNDVVQAVLNNNTVYGGAGDDFIHIGIGSLAYGGDGDDIILLSGNATSSYYVVDGDDGGGSGKSDVCIGNTKSVVINTENCEIVQVANKQN